MRKQAKCIGQRAVLDELNALTLTSLPSTNRRAIMRRTTMPRSRATAFCRLSTTLTRDKAHYVGSSGVQDESIDRRSLVLSNETRHDHREARVQTLMTGTHSSGIAKGAPVIGHRVELLDPQKAKVTPARRGYRGSDPSLPLLRLGRSLRMLPMP